jgi:hypothetical protein
MPAVRTIIAQEKGSGIYRKAFAGLFFTVRNKAYIATTAFLGHPSTHEFKLLDEDGAIPLEESGFLRISDELEPFIFLKAPEDQSRFFAPSEIAPPNSIKLRMTASCLGKGAAIDEIGAHAEILDESFSIGICHSLIRLKMSETIERGTSLAGAPVSIGDDTVIGIVVAQSDRHIYTYPAHYLLNVDKKFPLLFEPRPFSASSARLLRMEIVEAA